MSRTVVKLAMLSKLVKHDCVYDNEKLGQLTGLSQVHAFYTCVFDTTGVEIMVIYANP